MFGFNNKKRSFFERLTGSIRMQDHDDDFRKGDDDDFEEKSDKRVRKHVRHENGELWEDGEAEEGQLSVDVYQTPSEIVIVSMVAGVRPDELQIDIARDMITIRGKREESRMISDENYFTRELYWGAFSRTILLPQEIEPEEAEATEKHGLLVLHLPKLDKGKRTNVRVKSI